MKICEVAICHRVADGKSKTKICQRHENAWEKLHEGYTKWIRAYGKNYSKKQYYKTLVSDQSIPTGVWIREIINHLVEEELN